MVPPTSTDQSTGKRLDGLSRSAQWRDVDAERKAAAEARKATEANSQHGHTATNSRYSPPTELGRSLMIPADQLPLDSDNPEEPIARHSNDGSRDTYMESLIAQAAGPAADASIEPTDVDDGQTATDRFFEQQAISPPRPVARQTVAAGTAWPDDHRNTGPPPAAAADPAASPHAPPPIYSRASEPTITIHPTVCDIRRSTSPRARKRNRDRRDCHRCDHRQQLTHRYPRPPFRLRDTGAAVLPDTPDCHVIRHVFYVTATGARSCLCDSAAAGMPSSSKMARSRSIDCGSRHLLNDRCLIRHHERGSRSETMLARLCTRLLTERPFRAPDS